ncbi:glucosamine-6-phosphate deaminase [Pseudoteredinibacter isoporae]|uniref:glucosamine-6-phosphate deaminase n=1 Tax=Pseudoteredinibacter isoporae TaxID=570281 RepID=UPI003108AFE3
MRIVIKENRYEASSFAAETIAMQLQKKPNSVLGLATGSTPTLCYEQLIRLHKEHYVDFSAASSFNLDEYHGLSPDHPQSYRYFMQQKLFDHINIDISNTHVPDGLNENPIQACADYENEINAHGGIDLQLLGIGRNGHIGFNEPTSGLQSRTRIKTLTQSTTHANSRFFGDEEFQPELALTMGIGTILEAKKILLLAFGKEKSAAVQTMIEGALSAYCPASALQLHPDAIIVLDREAASRLEHIEFFIEVEEKQQALMKSLNLS